MTTLRVYELLTISYLSFIVFQISMGLSLPLSSEKFTREFCQDEHVQITCTRPHDVIVILEAKYGRMKIGKCVKGDYGGTGCVMDALFYLDHMCTGAQECRFRVFDATTLRERTACPEDVAAYVEVTYACVRALETESNECLVHKRITTQARATTSTLSTTTSTKHLNNNNNILINNDDDDRVYLSSVQTLKHNFASQSCPWLITTTRGQQITLYLRYVSPEYRESTDKYRKHNTDHQKYRHGNSLQNSNRFKADFKPICYDLLTIEDIDQITTNRHMLTDIILPSTNNNNINSIRHIPIPDHVTRVTTCHAAGNGYGGGEESELLKSRFSNVIVTTVAKQQLEGLGRFLLRYKVSGCPDLIPPYNATAQRRADKTTIKCNHSDLTWDLQCKNNSWIGDNNYNCNQGTHMAWGLTSIFDRHFPFGILIVVSSGVALGIFLGGLLLVCVVVYMRRVQNNDANCEKFLSATTTYNHNNDNDDSSHNNNHNSYPIIMTTPDVLDPAYNETASYAPIPPAISSSTFDRFGCKMHSGQAYLDAYGHCQQHACQQQQKQQQRNDNEMKHNINNNLNNNNNNNNNSNNNNLGCHGNQVGCQAITFLTSANKMGAGHLYELPRAI